MFDFAVFTVQHAFAGMWSMIWHWGVAVGLIILCLVGAYFTTAIPIVGPYLKDARHHLLWAAGIIAAALCAEAVGAADEAKHCAAQNIVIEKRVDHVVTKTKRPAMVKKTDRWDNPEN